MTSMTASALRPWRSKWMRWRSPLPLLVGPGTAEMQLGSHSGIRLASAMRSNTSWMETPTVPVYVRETGRMGIRYGGGGWWRMVEEVEDRGGELVKQAVVRIQRFASTNLHRPPPSLTNLGPLSAGERR